MEATELRIGNLINYRDEGLNPNITPIFLGRDLMLQILDGRYNVDYTIEPVPLTEEWLQRFGFEFKNTQREYGWFKQVLNRELCWCHSKEISLEFKSWQCDEYNNTLLDIKCEYVHSLQNLYFALTGEEL